MCANKSSKTIYQELDHLPNSTAVIYKMTEPWYKKNLEIPNHDKASICLQTLAERRVHMRLLLNISFQEVDCLVAYIFLVQNWLPRTDISLVVVKY